MHANLYDSHASDVEAITSQEHTWLSTCSGSGQRSSDGVNDRKGIAGRASERVYRVRVGDCRIVYEVFDRVLVVQVVRIGHRREVYR